MSGMDAVDRRLRELMDTAVGEPPRQISLTALRRRVIRRRRVEYATGAAAVAAVAVAAALIPAGVGARHAAGPDGRYGLGGRATVYAAYGLTNVSGRKDLGSAVIPINPARHRAGQPVKVGDGPIFIPGGQIAITPNGKTAYVADMCKDTVIPVSTASNTAGKPIELARPDNPGGGQIVITPDGKTAYVLAGTYTVHPIDTASNVAGPPIQVTSDCQAKLGSAQDVMAITPDGKTVYVVCQGAVVPISTASNLPGKPIRVPLGYPMAIAVRP